jgi:ABC-2 type transport system ATP-binding protein
MRQRLGIAAALLGDPARSSSTNRSTGSIQTGVRWVRHLMRRLAAEGRCVLVSSHLMAEMQQTADRVVVIGAGKLLGEFDISDLEEGTSLEEAYLRLTAGLSSTAQERTKGTGRDRGCHHNASREPGIRRHPGQ